MGIRKKFNQIFGAEESLEDERRRFVDRVNQVIFSSTEDMAGYSTIFRQVCFELGINADERIKAWRNSIGVSQYSVPELITLTLKSFNETLLVLSILYHCFKEKQGLAQTIELVLSKSTCDLGVRWHEGFFYPSGAKELDESLIEESLIWLKEYPDEQQNYKNALENYSKDEHSVDVVTNCYSALEGVARKILSNNKTLGNNSKLLLAKIGLSQGWKTILDAFINHTHNSRHAGKGRHEISKEEAEAFLYMTGLFIRLLIESR